MKKKEREIMEFFAAVMAEKYGLSFELASDLIEKSIVGGEIKDFSEREIALWMKERFEPNMFRIEEEEYLRLMINALRIQDRIAATDFGSSRQRDLGQSWSDTIRGYLGEMGFRKVMQKRWGIECSLGHREGELKDYLPMDVHKVKGPGDRTLRDPKIKISIKTVKFNGIWFDIPGDQFRHSDIYAQVKIGVETNHLFGFFKSISVFKDKILRKGIDSKVISEGEANEIFEKLPVFAPIIGYVSGFVERKSDYPKLQYDGKKGRKHFTVTAWSGPYKPSDVAEVKKKEGISGNVKFEGIQSFSSQDRYLFNCGNLLWKKEDWEKAIGKL